MITQRVTTADIAPGTVSVSASSSITVLGSQLEDEVGEGVEGAMNDIFLFFYSWRDCAGL
jgi:hypothetical protein